jgi:hypothetical protein
MAYATSDFSESLDRTGISPSEVEAVVAAWGQGNEGSGSKWSEDGGGTEWSGGFLLRLKTGEYVYVTGWCDYTGWGCQDGVEVYRFTVRPTWDEMMAAVKASNNYAVDAPPESEWDVEPADLNRWLSAAVATSDR